MCESSSLVSLCIVCVTAEKQLCSSHTTHHKDTGEGADVIAVYTAECPFTGAVLPESECLAGADVWCGCSVEFTHVCGAGD